MAKKLLLTRFYLDKLTTLTLTCKCTRYIMQIRLFVLARVRLSCSAETIDIDNKRSKTDFGYD